MWTNEQYFELFNFVGMLNWIVKNRTAWFDHLSMCNQKKKKQQKKTVFKQMTVYKQETVY